MLVVCNEMQQLRKMLDEQKIPWEDHSEVLREDDEMSMWFCRTWFEYNGKRWSAINGFGTYGGWYGANVNPITMKGADKESENLGLLELYNGEDDPQGWLTAKEAMILVQIKS